MTDSPSTPSPAWPDASASPAWFALQGESGRLKSLSIAQLFSTDAERVPRCTLTAAGLTLTGGGIQAALCLYKLNTFTLADTIREFPVASRFTKAVDMVAA